jgi:anti-anti-sigma regulatory factor
MNEQFELPAELTIYSAVETRDALLAWVAGHAASSSAHLKISARAVESVDGAGLQLLAALGSMGVSWELVAASEPFSEACRTMGLDSWLDSPYLQSQTAGSDA